MNRNLLVYFHMSVILDIVVISLRNIPEILLKILKSMSFAVLHNDRSDQRQVINRHSGEQMMFDLILESSTKEIFKPGWAIDVSGRDDLVSSQIMDLIFGLDGGLINKLSLTFPFELSLMISGNDPSEHGSSNQGTGKPYLPRDAGDPEDPVNSK